MPEQKTSPLLISIILSIAGWGLIMIGATWFLLSHSSHMATAYVIWVLMPPFPLVAIFFILIFNVSLATQGPSQGKKLRCSVTGTVLAGILFSFWFVCLLIVLVVGMSF